MSDTPRGHCWTCRIEPEDIIIPCPKCKVGEYCSKTCLERDKRRHWAECQEFGPKQCDHCGKTLKHRLECTVCSEAYYCDRTCQKKQWKIHKKRCDYVREQIMQYTTKWRYYCIFRNKEGKQMQSLKDLPFYFGNSMVADFLNLRYNEWEKPHLPTDPCLQRDYNVLSIACGDIRNLVLTMAALPEKFSGRLSVTMCDFDPFVMARNVLLLYMMVRYAETPDFAKTFTSIWYSTQISKNDYRLLDAALETLCTDDQSLSQLTNGLVTMPSEEVAELKQVWKRWHSMEFEIGQPDCIPLYEQRCTMQSHMSSTDSYMSYMRSGVPADQVDSFDKWFQDGIFAPSVSTRDDLPFYNPLLTGRTGDDSNTPYDDSDYTVLDEDHSEMFEKKSPGDFEFVYCIATMAGPFGLWEHLNVEKMGANTSIAVQHHMYVSSIVEKALTKKHQVSVSMTTAEFHDLKFDDDAKKFDRIFTSNLMDYQSIYAMIGLLGPWLNRDNPSSVIVTECLNSDYVSEPGGVIDEGEFRCENYRKRAFGGEDEMEYGTEYFLRYLDYGYDANWYMRWLKARYIEEHCQDINDASIPSPKTVLQCGEYRMRDVRTERNRVVPFFYQVGKRKTGVPATRIRNFEWVYAGACSQ